MDINNKNDESIESVPLLSRKRIIIPAFIAGLILTVAAVYWYLSFRGTISTDDAFVDGNRVTISSKYLGRIALLTVDEGSVVKKGDLLVKLDVPIFWLRSGRQKLRLTTRSRTPGLPGLIWKKAKMILRGRRHNSTAP